MVGLDFEVQTEAWLRVGSWEMLVIRPNSGAVYECVLLGDWVPKFGESMYLVNLHRQRLHWRRDLTCGRFGCTLGNIVK